ncbi:MAG: sulfatase [Gemmatimonadetes bacterium]|nr:sulfatase [Gemmatimonadota bacterium]
MRWAALRTALSLAVLSAAAAGWTSAALLQFGDSALGHFQWVSRDYLWMSPVAFGAVLVPLGVVLGVAGGMVRSTKWTAWVVGMLVVVATFGLLLPVSQLSRLASLTLAIGLGSVVARLALPRTVRLEQAAMRWATFTVVIVLVLALGLPSWRHWRSARALAALPAPPRAAPHVLLIVWDAARARDVGFVTPAAATTPLLDRWAAQGAVFTQAFSVGPWTLPSHASMLSGRYASELAADWTVPIEREHPVIPEILGRAGYATGAFVANLHYTAWDSGLDRGFHHVDDYERSGAQTIRSAPWTQTNLADTLLRTPWRPPLGALLRPDLSVVRQHRYQARLGGEVVDAYLAWRRQVTDRPTFGLVNLMDPHLKTRADTSTRRRYPHDERGLDDYREAMRYLDGEMDRLFSVLAAHGSLDSTLVILTSDHGELLGEHGLHGHAQSLYRDVVHVPLLLRLPGRVPATRIARAVSLRDLAATILDVTGASTGFPGQSLRLAWEDSTAATSPVFATARQQPSPLGDYPTAQGDLSGTFDSQWSYIINHGTGREELFRIDSAGKESGNLVDDPASAADLGRLRAQTEDSRRRFRR